MYCNIIDNWPCIEPFFQETASNCPTLFGPIAPLLKAYAIAVVQALGFTQGCFHVECKYSHLDDQVMLIEVNPRMGGGGTRMFHKEVYGVDLFENFLQSALGIPINPPAHETPLCGRAYYDVNALKSGILAHTRWLDHLEHHPNVKSIRYLKSPGEMVCGLDKGMPEWVGNIQVQATTVEEAVQLMRSFEGTLVCPIIDAEGKVVDVPAVVVGAFKP